MPFMRRNTAIAYCALWIAPYRVNRARPGKLNKQNRIITAFRLSAMLGIFNINRNINIVLLVP
jgi:hypothetical protein